MKKKVTKLIKILGIGLNELIIDMELSFITFNSIEWVKGENKIYLHILDAYDDLELSFDFDDLSKEDKQEVYNILSAIAYN